jgi:uncharacterized cupin superfamily protein
LAVSDKKSIGAVRLRSAPIEPSWIVAGAPRARCAELNRSRDGAAFTLVWDCTAGDFDWIYDQDETVHILEGEAIIDDGSDKRTIGPGDVFLFPAGTTFRWRVPVYVKKLAFLHVPIPAPAFLAVRGLRKLQALTRSLAGGGALSRRTSASLAFTGDLQPFAAAEEEEKERA